MFDTDGSGAIGNEELKQAMFSIGMHANEAEIDNVIKEARIYLSCQNIYACEEVLSTNFLTPAGSI
ncbi:hypothetical protein KIN20_003983 [Parelaphostrongylus tenuis]|uniref:EF-hand domain-containing protein n=1 Tax=Parelaphostrongylus tenuis TaxID=148309 RepID=A0AAD5M2D5_PARTN|nr:hypothetical protein KIN20_003983 [Parelaphostrongylus tenuis]